MAGTSQYSLAYVWKTPRTRFNVAVSSHRSYGTASLSLPDVKALAKASKVTINDVVLAVCAGALRRYLIEHQSLPDLPLTAAVPASLRAPGDTRMNNQLMFLLCRLATDVSDPLVRLAATQVAAREAKDLLADMKNLLPADVPVLGAPTIMTALYQLLQQDELGVVERGDLERAGAAPADLLRRRAGAALLSAVDTDSRLRAEHHGVWLCRSARVRIDRVRNGGARRATHCRLSGRRFRGDAARQRGAQQARGG